MWGKMVIRYNNSPTVRTELESVDIRLKKKKEKAIGDAISMMGQQK